MATAGPRIPTRGTNTEGIQAAANSPVMAWAKYTARTVRMALRGASGRLTGRHKSSVNSSLLAAVGASLLAALWLLSRRRPPAPMQRDVSDVVALNRAQITLARAPAASPDTAAAAAATAAGAAEDGETILPAVPADGGDRHLHLRRLEDLYRSGGERRLQAMTAARLWGHPTVLPLLRRGLRDADPRVMLEAARGMELFRGKPGAAAARGRTPQAAARPRRVARTR